MGRRRVGDWLAQKVVGNAGWPFTAGVVVPGSQYRFSLSTGAVWALL